MFMADHFNIHSSLSSIIKLFSIHSFIHEDLICDSGFLFIIYYSITTFMWSNGILNGFVFTIAKIKEKPRSLFCAANSLF